MAEGFYSNGLPHPSRGLRLRFAVELLVLVNGATAFAGGFVFGDAPAKTPVVRETRAAGRPHQQ